MEREGKKEERRRPLAGGQVGGDDARSRSRPPFFSVHRRLTFIQANLSRQPLFNGRISRPMGRDAVSVDN